MTFNVIVRLKGILCALKFLAGVTVEVKLHCVFPTLIRALDLWQASWKGDPQEVRKLLSSGANASACDGVCDCYNTFKLTHKLVVPGAYKSAAKQ